MKSRVPSINSFKDSLVTLQPGGWGGGYSLYWTVLCTEGVPFAVSYRYIKGYEFYCTFLGNSHPTPHLTQYFLTYYYLEQNVGLGEG